MYSFSSTGATVASDSSSAPIRPAQSETPPPQLPNTKAPWSTGLFDCFSDKLDCLLTVCCPCVAFGRVAEIVDKGSSSCGQNGALFAVIACVAGCPCFYSHFYRSKMRRQYSLRGSPCTDCLLHFLCQPCALAQEYRELKTRGFDLSIGWHGNMERRNRAIATAAPVVQGRMSRSDP